MAAPARVLLAVCLCVALTNAIPMGRVKTEEVKAEAAVTEKAEVTTDAEKVTTPAAKVVDSNEKAADPAKKADPTIDEYDEDRLYADQNEDFEAYKDDDDDGPDSGPDMKSEMDEEYKRYLQEMEGDMEEDEEMRREMIEELEQDAAEEGGEHMLDEEERDLLRLARKIQNKVDERSRLEEQERITVEHQRRMAHREQMEELGLPPRAGETDFGDKDMVVFMQEKVDHKKLMAIANKRVKQMGNLDRDRRRAFMQHEMRRLIDFKAAVEQVASPEDKAAMIKAHEAETAQLAKTRGHAPGREEQLKEVWEKDDGLDPTTFNPKTFFRMHDINGDGVLDSKELEGLFYREATRLHHQTDTDTDKKPPADPYVIREEAARMREFTMKRIDTDKDGVVSLSEFLASSISKDFKKDEGWAPINPEAEISAKQIENFKKLQGKLNGTKHKELDPALLKVARDYKAKFGGKMPAGHPPAGHPGIPGMAEMGGGGGPAGTKGGGAVGPDGKRMSRQQAVEQMRRKAAAAALKEPPKNAEKVEPPKDAAAVVDEPPKDAAAVVDEPPKDAAAAVDEPPKEAEKVEPPKDAAAAVEPPKGEAKGEEPKKEEAKDGDAVVAATE